MRFFFALLCLCALIIHASEGGANVERIVFDGDNVIADRDLCKGSICQQKTKRKSDGVSLFLFVMLF